MKLTDTGMKNETLLDGHEKDMTPILLLFHVDFQVGSKKMGTEQIQQVPQVAAEMAIYFLKQGLVIKSSVFYRGL